MSLRVAYLVNIYPKVSHSFIRREILALERSGVELQRVAIQGWDEKLSDPEDVAERARTQYVLKNGALALLSPTLRTLLAQPAQ